MNQSSISDYSSFRDAVYEAATDYSKFKNFLRHPEILKIFGHYKHENALKIWDKYKERIVKSRYIHSLYLTTDGYHLLPDYDHLDIYDSEGVMFADTFKVHSFFMEFIRVAFDIQDKLNIEHLYEYKIVELGIGFLGQYLTFDGMYNHYYMIDLPEVLLLANRIIKERTKYNDPANEIATEYLRNTDQISAFDTHRYPFATKGLDKHGIFFSSHAFSELTRETQEQVYRDIIKYCKKGYILMNDIGHYHGVSNMRKQEHIDRLKELGKKEITIHEEWPLTFKGNYVLTWE